jgi:DNA-binding Lrp family transcriptional regulator
MLPNKLSRLLYELSVNSRISTKELGKILRMSQQNASHMVHAVKKRGLVQEYKAVVDPARLGLLNVIVLYHYKTFDKRELLALKVLLSKHPFIVRIEEVSQGADLLLEYSAPNLSLFNKQHTQLIHEQKALLKIAEMFVVIVKHVYDRKYLSKVPTREEVVLCGDRDIANFTGHELQVLNALNLNPKHPIVRIAQDIHLDTKTVARLKKGLEQAKVVRKFSVTLNNEAAGISRHLIFANLDFDTPKGMRRLLDFCLNHKNIVAVNKLIGGSEVMLECESQGYSQQFLRELRESFKVEAFRIIQSDKIIKDNHIPDMLWGLL